MANRPRRRNSSPRRRRGGVGIGTRLAAQLSILLALGGIPYALYTLAGNPLPDRLPSWTHLGELLTTRDDGSLFLSAVTWAGWIGWASFALPLLVEITCHVLRLRPPRIFGLAWQQRRAAALVAAALSIGATPAVASASAVTITASPASAAAPPSTSTVTPHEMAAAFAAPPTSPATIHSPATIRVGHTTTAQSTPTYVVAPDDWLYYVAERFLGDGDRYVDIAKLNPELERADARFPDHIEARQHIKLPADAHDRGVREHATGNLRTTTQPPAEPGPDATPPEPPATQPTPPSASTAPSPTTSASPSASASSPPPQTPEPTASAPMPAEQDQSDDADDSSLDAALPITAALATAGLLAALLLFRLTQRRRSQRRYRRPGRRIPQPPNATIERRVRAAAQPVDVNRLDHALRALAAGLRDRDQSDLPDLAAAWLAGGEVHLMLAQANADAPPPFQADDAAMTWTLPATATLPNVDETLAPLPVLVTVASRPGGDHLLIDLERTGLLGVGGDPERAADLMRYLAAELATNQWSDDAEVVLAGFDPLDADSLIAIGGDRITAVASASAAIDRTRRRAAANTAAMNDTGITSTFAGRVGDIVADAWMPHVLLIANADGAEDELSALEAELRLAGRCAVAVAAITTTPTTWRIDVAADGGLAIDWLSITNTTATRLPREQLTRLAPVMRAARAAAPTDDQPADEPVPAATEPDPWAEGTDAHGHLLNSDAPHAQDDGDANNDKNETGLPAASPVIPDHEQEGRPAVPEPAHHAQVPADPLTSTQPVDATTLPPIKTGTGRTAPPSPARRREPNDPELDADLDAWYRPDPYRPRIAILGPVLVEAPGEAPEERLRFYSELVVYLAQRGRSGATGEQIDDALWPERGVSARSRRVAISKVRRWLGENADGTHWLPLNAGADRLYRLTPGVLLDWQLFRRLRARGEAKGAAGASDLRRALELVRGEPLAGAELPYSSGYRNPYTWLPGSDVQAHNLASAIVDTAHQLVDLYLGAGDITGARWAVERAWLADPSRLDDHPWVDAMRVARADGRSAELRALLDDLVRTREVEVPEDLSPDTYAAIHGLVGDLLRVG
jgi:hypothetical protein